MSRFLSCLALLLLLRAVAAEDVVWLRAAIRSAVVGSSTKDASVADAAGEMESAVLDPLNRSSMV